MAPRAVAASAVSSSIWAASKAIATRRIDQHRRAVLATGQGTAEGHRMTGDDQADAEQSGVGGQLFRGAGPLAVGGDHHRSNASHHQAGGQTGNGQCLAGARRPDQQQRRLATAGCRTGSHWPVRSRAHRAGGRRAVAAGTPWKSSAATAGGVCGRHRWQQWRRQVVGLERSGDFHAVTEAAGGEDQRVLAQFGADLCHRLRHRGSAEELQAHGGMRRSPLPRPPPAAGRGSRCATPPPLAGGGRGEGAPPTLISSPPFVSLPADGSLPAPGPACSAGCAP